MTVIRTTSLIVFECKDRSCAPPPVGTGGSKPSGSSSDVRADSADKAIRVGTKEVRKRLKALEKKYDNPWSAQRLGDMSEEDSEALEAIDSLEWYTETGHERINYGLRYPGWAGQEPDRRVKAIDRAFDMFGVEITKPVTVLRGIPAGGIELDEGMEFEDKAFVSTTTSKTIAQRFASGFRQSGGGVVLRINVPAGSRVLAGRGSEGELILPRGSRFRVRAKRGPTGLGRPAEVEVDLL